MPGRISRWFDILLRLRGTWGFKTERSLVVAGRWWGLFPCETIRSEPAVCLKISCRGTKNRWLIRGLLAPTANMIRISRILGGRRSALEARKHQSPPAPTTKASPAFFFTS